MCGKLNRPTSLLKVLSRHQLASETLQTLTKQFLEMQSLEGMLASTRQTGGNPIKPTQVIVFGVVVVVLVVVDQAIP